MPEPASHSTLSGVLQEQASVSQWPGYWEKLRQRLTASQLLFVVDAKVESLHSQRLALPEGASLVTVEASEPQKTQQTVNRLWAEWFSRAADRKAVVVAIGGGITTDLAGYAAACWKRGLRWVAVPTTLLAMTDAAIGGKTGVNFQGAKNLIGAFHQPEIVLQDVAFLETLPQRVLRSGFAEMLKHGLVADRLHWMELVQNDLHQQDWARLIPQSANIKANIVAQDFREKGKRRILNFGHSIGHALESLSHLQGRPMLHGEAVALGMIAETRLSEQHCGLLPEEARQIRRDIRSFEFPALLPEWDSVEMTRFLQQDKKNQSGKLHFALLKTLGYAFPAVEVKLEDALAVTMELLAKKL